MVAFAANPLVDMYFCLHDQHKPQMLLVAVGVMITTGACAVLSIRRARNLSGAARFIWATVAGISLGTGEWATHYAALLGYIAGIPIGFELSITAVSLIISCLGCAIATNLLMLRVFHHRTRLIAASLFHGGGLAVMHYTGMAGLNIPATIQWHPGFVAASIVIAMSVSVPALWLALNGQKSTTFAGSVVCFVTLVMLTHFVGMTALKIVPSGAKSHGSLISTGSLAAWIGIAVMSVFSGGLIVLLANRHGRAALEQSEKLFLLLVNATSDYGICILDCDGRVSQWNTGAERLTGYSAGEAIGMPMENLFAADGRANDEANKALAIAQTQGLYTHDAQGQRRDGSVYWASGSLELISDEHGVLQGYSLIMRDISQHKEAQELVAETSRRLDSALENMHEGLCLFDADERIVLSNRRFRELWCIDVADCMPGTPLSDLIMHGFMNPEGADMTTRHLWKFREMLDDTLSEEYGTPAVVEMAENRIISIANNALPDGGWVTTCTDITEQRQSEAQIEYMALHDALTGLPNRARYYIGLDEMIERARTQGLNVAVAAIDLDRFKDVNDTQGHAAGDRLLQAISGRLQSACREDEIVARQGGDEFAAAKLYADPAEIDEFVARLRSSIDEPIEDADQPLSVGASIGVATYPLDGVDRETLLNNADLAMYRAKVTIGGIVSFFEPEMDEHARQRRQIASDLRQAIDRGELALLYQPQRSLLTDSISGYEALLRWHHPIRGLVPPDEFIPIAEETGEIFAIGEWVLRNACKEARNWPSDCKVAVNLSPVQFIQQGLVEKVQSILVETGLSPKRLELEITETAIISDKLRALHCLRQFKGMGVSVAIDDFGTGYSSLDTLQSFPFDKIKIDKSFLASADTSVQARAIIRAILALGKSLEIPVLAEGVETEKQLQVLLNEGCQEAQGYYFGRPAGAPSLLLPMVLNQRLGSA